MKKKSQNNSHIPEAAHGPAAGFPLSLWIGLGLASALATVLAYAGILNAPFVFDDQTQIFLNPAASTIPLSGWIGLNRGLTSFSFWVNYILGGTEPLGYHWLSLLLHLASGVLVALIVRKLLARSSTLGATRDALACFSGAVFLLHPLQTEAVAYIASRSEVLAVFFLWAAFAHFLYRKRDAVSWYDSIVILLLFGLACLSKEYSVVFPAILLLADYYWNAAGIRGNWRLYGPMAIGAVAGAALILRVVASANTVGFGLQDLSPLHYFLTQCRVIWVYIFKFLLPVNQTIDYDFALTQSLGDPFAVLGLLGLAGATVAAIVYRKQYPVASFGWIVFLITLAPTSSFLPIRDVIVERRVYFPSIGLLLILVEFLRRAEWTAVRQAALLGVALVLAVLTAQRNNVWASPESLWRDASLKAPQKSRPHFQLGRIFYQNGNFNAAASEYELAAKTGGQDHTLLLNWGLALDDAGRSGEAIAKLLQAAQLHPDAHVYSQIARHYGRNNENDKALEALAQVQRFDPNFEMGYVYRGNIYLNQGNRARAIAEYNHALSINPNNVSALEGLRLASQNRH